MLVGLLNGIHQALDDDYYVYGMDWSLYMDLMAASTHFLWE